MLLLIILFLTGSLFIAPKPVAMLPPAPRYPYRIALTFDDGPHPLFTDSLLRLLRDNNVHATFFVVGRLAMEYPNLAGEISLAGHELEGHTFTHRNLNRLSDKDVTRELVMTKGILEKITGKQSLYFRPPGGRYNGRVVNLAAASGLSMVLWTVFPKDHEEPNPDVILARVLAQASDGGVVLLHSGVPATYQALPRIIRELRSRGYRFVTISELNARPAPLHLVADK
jgi:peptidoglycan/xylan/chitin deacetylase (PgdA/CDA1 family)